MTPTSPPVPLPPRPPGATSAFLAQVGLQLGMPADVLQALEAGEPFSGPSGLLCRVHTGIAGGRCIGHPEVLLPLAAAELGGPDVPRLLGVQEQLLHGEGWLLGLMAGGGLLALRPLQGQHDAVQVAADLDRGQVLARAALEVLVPAEGTDPEAGGPDCRSLAGAGAAP